MWREALQGGVWEMRRGFGGVGMAGCIGESAGLFDDVRVVGCFHGPAMPRGSRALWVGTGVAQKTTRSGSGGAWGGWGA